MIKFFRKIRQKLLIKGRTKQYLKYAAGEIVLVVIGILIALQINSWNDYRKQRNNEQLILKNLKDNLESDKNLLTRFHDNAQLGVKAVDTMLLMVNGHIEFDFLSFSTSVEKILTNNYFQTTSATFDQAMSTGKIDLIRDEKLLSSILNYYKLTKLNFEDNRILETNQSHVFPKLFSQLAPTKTIALALTGVETNLPELDINSLATNKDFNTWVIFKKIAFQRQAQNYMELKKDIINLIEIIDQQLVH